MQLIEEDHIFLRFTLAVGSVSVGSNILQSLDLGHISFIFEVIGLIIINLYFFSLIKIPAFLKPQNIIGLNKKTLFIVLGIAFLISIPFWFYSCIAIGDFIAHRGAFAAFAYSTLIKAPVFEEIYFRGVLFWYLQRRFTTLYAAAIASFLFSLIHIPLLFVEVSFFTLFIVIGTFFFGYALCLIQKYKNNLLLPILLHFLANLIIIFSGVDPFVSNPLCL